MSITLTFLMSSMTFATSVMALKGLLSHLEQKRFIRLQLRKFVN